MEQWMKDGRQLLFDRWQAMGGVVGSKSQPHQVKDVDDEVLKYVLQVFARNRLHACVASPLLHKSTCRLVDDAAGGGRAAVLEFKFPCGRYFPVLDRSGYFGLLQRAWTRSQVETLSAASSPKPSARVLIDYCWVFEGRIYDYTRNFSFVAGAGVVPQALEESVLYCSRSQPQSVRAIYEASSGCEAEQQAEDEDDEGDDFVDNENKNNIINPNNCNKIKNNNDNIVVDNSRAEGNRSSASSLLKEGASFLDEMDQFLCDSGFAFRDEGTKLPASDFDVGFDIESGKTIAVKAKSSPMVIPGDAAVALFVKVKKFCNAVSATTHIEIAESLKSIGNDVLSGKQQGSNAEEQQQQQQQQESLGNLHHHHRSPHKSVRARKWYERAMLELTPEAMRISEKTGGSGELNVQAIGEKIQSLLTSIAHNISLCYFEEAGSLSTTAASDEQSSSSSSFSCEKIKIQNQKQDLYKKSIRFAAEAIKASNNKHVKSIFRRASANVQLGNFEEAESDLKLMESVAGAEVASRDPAVAALKSHISTENSKAKQAMRQAMAKEFAS